MHYVIGDIHCQIGMLKRLLEKLELKPEDEVYFVGDWLDRAYCYDDMYEMYDWMVENLVPGSQFKSVYGNHDMGMYTGGFAKVEQIIRDMPLYHEFEADGVKYLVTHSWLIDNNGKPFGTKAFDKDDINAEESVWDRDYSVNAWDYEEDIPVVIHGHTPTLGECDVFNEVIRPLAKIKRISDKNINVDCCAFYSPIRGGNLAAYRCEDGKVFYAYEDEEFYTLADRYIDSMIGEVNNISMDEYLFATLFYGKYDEVLDVENKAVLSFQNRQSEEAYLHFRHKIEGKEQARVNMDMRIRLGAIRDKIRKTVGAFWLNNRETI